MLIIVAIRKGIDSVMGTCVETSQNTEWNQVSKPSNELTKFID